MNINEKILYKPQQSRNCNIAENKSKYTFEYCKYPYELSSLGMRITSTLIQNNFWHSDLLKHFDLL